jgi:hypothetical protein
LPLDAEREVRDFLRSNLKPTDMNTLNYLFQEAQIHFLVNGSDKQVMINATEMAKVFGKKTELFLKSKHAKAFIEELKKTRLHQPNGGSNLENIIDYKSVKGVYFCEELALKFAAWLSPKFELWVYSTIKEITFGNYKKHWDAHAAQEEAKKKMEELKTVLLTNPTTEAAQQYFLAERDFKNAKNEKSNAIRNQLKMFS